MIKSVIFDFDGTLAALTLDIGLVKDEVARIARKYVDETFIAEAKDAHPYVLEMVYALEARCGDGGEALRAEAYRKLYEAEKDASKGKALFGYARQVLHTLRQKNMRIAILTRSCREVLSMVFPDINQYVDAVVTREDVRYAKPHPSHTEITLALLGARKDEAIIVGDQVSDVMAGKVVGIGTVGVLTGKTTRHEFEAVHTDYIVEDVRGLLRTGTIDYYEKALGEDNGSSKP